jgi:hypothetical protein
MGNYSVNITFLCKKNNFTLIGFKNAYIMMPASFRFTASLWVNFNRGPNSEHEAKFCKEYIEAINTILYSFDAESRLMQVTS